MQERALEGKVAIVTGAGRGIGRAIAIGYARAGAAVCCAARTAAQIDDTAKEIERAGGAAIAVPTDVTRLASVHAMIDATVGRYGGLDIVVINAGVNGERKSVEAADPERWRALPNLDQWQVTPVTATLLRHRRARQRDATQAVRPFFFQVEAVETAIWLHEVAPKSARHRRFLDSLRQANAGATPTSSASP